MTTTTNISLKPYNTFGIDVTASTFIEIDKAKELNNITHELDLNNILVLGGGSNLLFTQNYEGTILKINIRGIEVTQETSDFVHITFGAGEIWHDCVLYCIRNNWAGIENLSLIPGTIGAAPVQNIGAYGVELKDVFSSCTAYNLTTQQFETFKTGDCEFGYRNSTFKGKNKGKYIITNVTLKLNKNATTNSSYGAIENILSQKGITKPTIKDISDAVIAIRESKLPNPLEIGNAGSFFKNPEISTEAYQELKEKHPEVPGYVISDSVVKVPAGWLIDQAGWKGKKIGRTGVHDKQALVLVNHGNAKGKAIKDLAFEIKADILKKFGITITPEVNII